ncbi:hypothetical protein CBM2606_A70101 [Cupriavidus taiwanensis]|nr:hypothetical protein CBM2606_A70101 [Cupriavidus taiwanensis]
MTLHQPHAALERAAILAARHYLLARIAALAEIDPADQLEIDHLRHELLLRRRDDAGQARLDFEPVPQRRRGSCQRGGQLRAQRVGTLGRQHQLPARLAGAIRQADHGGAVGRGHGKGGFRRGQPGRCQRPGGAGAGQAEDGMGRSDVGQPGLGAQHEHRQALLHRGLDLGRQLQHDAVGVAPHQEGGQQPALGRAVAGQARRARRQVVDRVGQLGVQEAGGIVARHADEAEPGRGANHAAGLQRVKVGGELLGLGIQCWHCEAIVEANREEKETGHRGCAVPGARAAPAPRLTVGAGLPVIIWGYEIFGRRRWSAAACKSAGGDGGQSLYLIHETFIPQPWACRAGVRAGGRGRFCVVGQSPGVA